jgi:2-polyprenyl-6-methoxyphenol hydroxylase-like FAD-dependent oxidoreductase
MTERPGCAVVLGASMGGLLAARVLSTRFERVIVVERDLLPAGPGMRKGVPQAAHAHGLLASGYQVIDAYFPGLMEELEDLGAARGDTVGDFLWFLHGRWKLRQPAGLRGIGVSRPCLEAAIRERVRALPNVRVLDGTEAVAPLLDSTGRRVRGLTIQPRKTDGTLTLDSDLLVDASGRGSRSERWLQEWGYRAPESLTIRVDVGYATRLFERRDGDFFGSNGGVIAGAPPGTRRVGAVLAAEGHRWVITLVGILGDHPPSDEDGWLRFAASLPVRAVHDLAASAKPLGDVTTYRYPANERRLYERLRELPEGYLVLGDALCTFNPIYGQGMSVAAMEARALEEDLTRGLEGLPHRFYRRAAKIIDIPWAIATGEDLLSPAVEGPRPPGFRQLSRYLERVHALASLDPLVCTRFFRVLNLLAPPSALLSPGVAWRVLTRSMPAGEGTPLPDRGEDGQAPRRLHAVPAPGAIAQSSSGSRLR